MNMNRKNTIVIVAVATSFIMATFALIQSAKARNFYNGGSSNTNISAALPTQYALNKIYTVPDSLYFAGERVPLEFFDVRESLEREIYTTAYRHSSTILVIKRANRCFPVIEKILAENGIPDDFKYLVAAESEFVNVTSPAGAVGYWQILRSTGTELGLEINGQVDERYNLELSTQAACKYLKKSYEKYQNWTLAAASYNNGRNGLSRQIERQNNIDNYYDLLLNEETARYIFRVLSYKMIISDPAAYGFDIHEEDLYQPLQYEVVKVDKTINDFAKFAAEYGTNYKILKNLNPWLRDTKLSYRAGKSYEIKMPTQNTRTQTDE